MPLVPGWLVCFLFCFGSEPCDWSPFVSCHPSPLDDLWSVEAVSECFLVIESRDAAEKRSLSSECFLCSFLSFPFNSFVYFFHSGGTAALCRINKSAAVGALKNKRKKHFMRDHFCFSFPYVASLREKHEGTIFQEQMKEFSSSLFCFLYSFFPISPKCSAPERRKSLEAYREYCMAQFFQYMVTVRAQREAWGFRRWAAMGKSRKRKRTFLGSHPFIGCWRLNYEDLTRGSDLEPAFFFL